MVTFFLFFVRVSMELPISHTKFIQGEFQIRFLFGLGTLPRILLRFLSNFEQPKATLSNFEQL
jgi:hypothetical protein